MVTKQRFVRSASVAVAALLISLTLPAVNASATLTCNQINGAPSVANGDWAGFTTRQDVRGYYYHSCNTTSGITSMDMGMGVDIFTSGGYWTTYCDGWGCSGYRDWSRIDLTRAHNETAIDSPDGYYRTSTQLFLVGTFSYGSVSGCGRVNYQQVDCYWNSGAIYHVR